MTAADPSGMLAALVAAPDDRTGRLAYADWLDEHDRGAEAAFTRLQCRMVELRAHCICGACVNLRGGGQHTNGPCIVTQRDDDGVRPRERQVSLLAAHEKRWRASGPCDFCEGKGALLGCAGDRSNPTCGDCYGTGDRGGLLRPFYYPSRDDNSPGAYSLDVETGNRLKADPVRIDWSRYPLLTLRVPRLDDCVIERTVVCAKCDGWGERASCDKCVDGSTRSLEPLPWLRAVLTHHPQVIGVEPMDRCPIEEPSGSNRWAFTFDAVDHPSPIPLPIWHLVHGKRQGPFAAHGDAVPALGRAVARFAREFLGGRDLT